MQLLLVNRQVLDGRRDLIDAETELRVTRVARQQAAGWLDVGARCRSSLSRLSHHILTEQYP